MLGELLSNDITLLRPVNIKSLNVEQGLLERSWLCGVLPFEILASHILSQLGVIIVQVCDCWYNLSTISDSCFLNSTIFFIAAFLTSPKVVLALVTVFGVFGLPCRGSLLLTALLSLLQGENKYKM